MYGNTCMYRIGARKEVKVMEDHYTAGEIWVRAISQSLVERRQMCCFRPRGLTLLCSRTCIQDNAQGHPRPAGLTDIPTFLFGGRLARRLRWALPSPGGMCEVTRSCGWTKVGVRARCRAPDPQITSPAPGSSRSFMMPCETTSDAPHLWMYAEALSATKFVKDGVTHSCSFITLASVSYCYSCWF